MTQNNGSRYDSALRVAVQAAREAGELIREHAGRMGAMDVRAKGVNDLVTDVDEAVQALIIRTLQKTFPQALFLAEEGDQHSLREDRRLQWIIDPIDGTTNFMHGVPPYAVSIALRDGGELAVGVVLDAASGELFTAVRGGGLHVNGEVRRVSDTARLKDGLITTGFPYRELSHIDHYLGVLGEFMRRSRGVRRPGSAAIDLAYVAAGRFDGFFETGLQPWDVAAGTLLVQEAGGRVTAYRREPDPVFDQQILATNGAIHAEMLAVLEPMKHIHL